MKVDLARPFGPALRTVFSLGQSAMACLAWASTALGGEFNKEQRAELLHIVSPSFISDGPDEYPPVNPSFFAEECRIFDSRSNIWVNPPSGQANWKASELAHWLQDSERSEQSAHLSIAPEEWRRQGPIKESVDRRRRSTEQAIREGSGVFGHVAHLGGNTYSVKYFLFLTWSQTAFAGGEGSHDGDWLCLDFQVTADDPAKPWIEYAIYHNHRRAFLVENNALELRDERPVAYLERGTNEPWPNSGGRGYEGHPRTGVRSNGYLPKGRWLRSEYMGSPEHRGKGLVYDTLGKVRNLETCRDVDCRLVLGFRGRWGKASIDNWQWLHRQKISSPPSGRWQAKMWDRAFTSCTNDPRSDTAIWLSPPFKENR